MNSKITFALLFLIVSFGVFAQSVTIEGDPYGGNPYSTIDAAITAANVGDVILISGVHTESLSFGKSITLRGTDPTVDIIQAAASPSSDGTGSNVINVIRAVNTDVLNVTIENLGIRHGNEGTKNGGGINVDKVTGKITLNNLIIEDNYTIQNGGGVAFDGSNADVINCTIRNNNSTENGGGIIMAPNNASGINNNVNIQQSLIDNNEGRNGGGIFINGNNNFGNDYTITNTIENTTISNNSAYSGDFASGGGAIWSRAETWTTNDGGDGTSTNVILSLIHSTFYNNFHEADIKSGIQGTGGNNTEFSAYNSIIVHDGTTKRAINFANLNTIQVKNCILGGLNAAPGAFLDEPPRNNLRGRTATFAGLSGVLSNEGGNTQVIPIADGSNAQGFCTADVTEVTLPAIDQRGYLREPIPDCGAFELDATFVCKIPESVTLINVASSGASLIWTKNPDAAEGYQWVVVESGNDPDAPGDIEANGTEILGTTRAAVNGLNNNTAYDFYVRSACSPTDESDWSTAISFTTSSQGNLFSNSRFTDINGNPSLDADNDGTPEWGNYGIGAEIDHIIGENVGFIGNSEGLLRQDFNVIPGVTYLISFSYRWVSESSSSNTNPPRTPVIRNDQDNDLIETLPAVQTLSDTWFTYSYAYTHPTSGLSTPTDRVRFQIFKADDNNQLNFYNITVLENVDFSADYDFVYKNGAWSSDITTSTSTNTIYVYNGLVNLNNNVTASNFEVSPWADVNVEQVLDITNELKVEEGGVLTFKSSAAGSGQLKSSTIVGEVRTERFIPSQTNNRRAFRFVSSSVNSSSPIYDNWQMRGSLVPDQLGTHISGSATGANGFDETITGNPSLFTFDSAWDAIPNTDNTNLELGRGYRLMVRGDRKYDLTSNPVDDPNSDVILRAKGEMLSGTLTTGADLPALSTAPEGFSFVGNPYQAVVNFKDADKTNLTNFIYVWDASLAGNNGRGTYVTVDLSQNPSVPDPSSSSANEFIAPGQAFFVQNTIDGNGSITFEEAHKATAEPQVTVFNTELEFYINSRLYQTLDLQNGKTEKDAIGLRFSENYTTLGSDEDASKLINLDENYSIVNNGRKSIDKQNFPKNGHEVILSLLNYKSSDYSLIFDIGNAPEGMEVYLLDNYLGTKTKISTDTVYAFTVDSSHDESKDENRFILKFEETTLNINRFDAEDISLYPNPVKDVLSISLPNTVELMSAKVYNMMRQELASTKSHSIQMEDFSAGIYLVEVETQQGKLTKKVIKQ